MGVKVSNVQLFYHKDYEINPVLFSEASLINSKNNISKEKKVIVILANL